MRIRRRRVMIEGLLVLAFFASATLLLLGSYHQAVQAPFEQAGRGAQTPGYDGVDVRARELTERASFLGVLGGLAALVTVVFAVAFTRDAKRFVHLQQVRTRQKAAVREAYHYLRGKMGPPRVNN